MAVPTIPQTYPNHLALAQPERLDVRPVPWLLTLLVLLCLVPRITMALRIPSVCPDGVLYIQMAQTIEAGNLRAALHDMDLNVYPFVLAGLHKLGLDWEMAAAVWGVTIASLVVLPLFGWVRRQFDDRVAVVACLLYAVNPKMIEWSPEVMRDPTFWFLFTLSLYWLWRAVTEVHLGYFTAAGGAVLLSAMTRIEGLFLLIPLMLWTFWRLLALRCDRRRLLLGVVLCVFVFPLLLLVVNLLWLSGRAGWTLPRFDPLARVQPWLQAVLGHASHDSVGEAASRPLGVGRMLWVFFPTMTRGLSPVFALLMFAGMLSRWRVWLRRDHQPLFYAAALVMCGIWVQLWYDKTICPRYALPIVLMASPWAAIGVFWLIGRLQWAAERLRGSPMKRPTAIVASVAAVIVGISLLDTIVSNGKYFRTRQMANDLGCWMRQELPAESTLVGPVGDTPIVSYYANQKPYETFRWEDGDDLIVMLVQRRASPVVLLRPAKELTPARCEALVQRLQTVGLQPLDPSRLPATCRGVWVLLKSDGRPI